MKPLHRIRHWLSGPNGVASADLFHHHSRVFCRLQPLIRAYYAFVAFLAIVLVPEWGDIMGRGHVEPLWPVFWLNDLNLRPGIAAVLIIFTVGALFAAMLPQYRWSRILAFVGVLEYWAFNNSFGKVGHSLHNIVLVSFVLIFLPAGWHESEQRQRIIKQRTLLIFWAAQCTVMLTYTMAGFIKIVGGLRQMLQGQPNMFLPDSLARQVADRLLQTGSQSWYGGWLINHIWVGWPLMLGTVYLELFALQTVFRPRLQPAFVIGLVLFHLSSFFTMTIIFPQNCFLLFLFFAGMPLSRGTWTWKGFWLDWPIFGDLWMLWKARVS